MANEVSLSDLNIIYHSQIKFDDITLPLKIDIANITEYDYILSVSAMNQYKLDVMEQQPKEHNELDDIKIIKLENDIFTMSYKTLDHQFDLDILEEDTKIDYCIKFINTTDKLFDDNTKNLLEYFQTENIKEVLFEKGFGDVFYFELYTTVSYWVDMILKEFTDKVKFALLLDANNKNGTEMNHSLSRLKSCYDNMTMKFFKENAGVTVFESLSYREQHLIQSYFTKMNYIDIAINKDAKKQMEDRRDNTPAKHKNPAGAKRGFR